jgi:hypothetical protein
MSIQGLLFAILLALFVIAWIVMPLLQRRGKSADDPLLEKQRERLLYYYERVLRNIHDLDEDHALGKIDEGEYGREREEWAERGVQVLQALDTITEKEVGFRIAETPADDDASVDHAIDDAIEAAIQTYRQRNPQ